MVFPFGGKDISPRQQENCKDTLLQIWDVLHCGAVIMKVTKNQNAVRKSAVLFIIIQKKISRVL